MAPKVITILFLLFFTITCSEGNRLPDTSDSYGSGSTISSSKNNSQVTNNTTSSSSNSSARTNTVTRDGAGNTQYVWKRDIFDDSSLFKGCAFSSNGVGSTGNKGSELTELYFLRSAVKEQFFWSSELTDIRPNDYQKDPKSFENHIVNMKSSNGYYAKFLSTSITFKNDNVISKYLSVLSDDEIEKSERISASASFGINWGLNEAKKSKKLFVRFKEVALGGVQYIKLQNVNRGDKLISLDGIDVRKLLEAGNYERLYGLLYPKKVGVVRKFVFENRSDRTKKTVFLSSYTVYDFIINNHEKTRLFVENEPDPFSIGYLIIPRLDTQNGVAERELNHAFDKMKNFYKVKDLIVDFRYTSKGSLEVASQLATLIAGDSTTNNKIFARFKASVSDQSDARKGVKKNIPFIWHCLDYQFPTCPNVDNSPSWISYVPLKHRFRHILDLDKVYVIVSNETCGVAEAFINGLLGIDFEVILIGGNTCGKPYIDSYIGSCGIKYNVPKFQVLNHKGFGSYEKGFRPSNATHLGGIPVKGCFAEESNFEHSWGSLRDPFISAALQYRKDGTCPSIPKNVLQSHN